MTTIASRAMRIASDADAAKNILSAVGDVSGIDVLGPRVLVAVYERAEGSKEVKTAGGVIVPWVKGGTLDEDQFQGKVCLVLKKGSLAFREGYAAEGHDNDVKEGDWIVLRPTDGFAMLRGNVTCRLVKDADILMKVPSPDAVF